MAKYYIDREEPAFIVHEYNPKRDKTEVHLSDSYNDATDMTEDQKVHALELLCNCGVIGYDEAKNVLKVTSDKAYYSYVLDNRKLWVHKYNTHGVIHYWGAEEPEEATLLSEAEFEDACKYFNTDNLTFRKENPKQFEQEEGNTIIKPDKYNQYPIETIVAIEGQSTPQEFEGFLKGCIMKYLARYNYNNGAEDLKKAQFYLQVLAEYVDGEDIEDIIFYLESNGVD